MEPGVQGGESACVGKGRGAGQGGGVQGVSVPCCLDFAEEDGVAGVACILELAEGPGDECAVSDEGLVRVGEGIYEVEAILIVRAEFVGGLRATGLCSNPGQGLS